MHIYSLIALLLLAASSCQREPLPQDPGTYIAFTPDLTPTKAPIESADDISEFAVKVYHDQTEILPPSTDEKWTIVSKESDGFWRYEPLQPWSDGTFYFGAVYPVPAEDRHFNAQLKLPKEGTNEAFGMQIDYYQCPKTADEDLMIAERTVKYNSQSPNVGAVVMNFRHLLSRISIVAQAANEGISIQSVTFSGMHVCGSYDDSGDGTTAGTTQAHWTAITEYPAGAPVAKGTFTFTPTEETLPQPLTPGNQYPILTDLLLIPQNPSSATISVIYTITYDDSTTPSEPITRAIILPSAPLWEPGTAYTYTFTIIDDQRIIFDTPQVNPWDEASGGIIIVE